MTKKSRQHKKGIIICFLSIDIKNKDTRRVKNKKKEEILVFYLLYWPRMLSVLVTRIILRDNWKNVSICEKK